MPEFSWKWFWSKVFDEFDSRDFFVFLGAVALFVLICVDKIHSEHLGHILSAIGGYAVGRPNFGRRDDDRH